MSIEDAAIAPIANEVLPEAGSQPPELLPEIPPETIDGSLVDAAMQRLEASSGDIDFADAGRDGAVRSLADLDGAQPAVFRVEGQTTPPPTFEQAMSNFRSATGHAVEISVISTAGSSMAGSMSKLMSGN